MLSNGIMGALALAIVWVNALLVAGAALKELGPLGELRRKIAAGAATLARGRVTRGDGPDGALAAHEVEQLGRATDAGEILFADRAYASRLFGGAITLDHPAGRSATVEGGEVVDVPAGDAATTIWVSPAEAAAAAACPSPSLHAEALPVARKAKGYARRVDVLVARDAEVWIAREGADVGLVSTVDPIAFARGKALLVVGFVLAELAAAAAVTALALVPPVFGTVSKIGGALGLAFFLSVQPLGTAVRDAVRRPDRRVLRGRWRPPT